MFENKSYVTDTNNHLVRTRYIKTNVLETLKIM